MSESQFDEIVQQRSIKAIDDYGAITSDKLAKILRDEHGISTIATPVGQPPMDTDDLENILNQSKYLEQNKEDKWHIKGKFLLTEENEYWKERPNEKIMDYANYVISNIKDNDHLNMVNAFNQLTSILKTNNITNVSEQEMGIALEIASKEQNYEKGYIEERNYPTKEKQ